MHVMNQELSFADLVQGVRGGDEEAAAEIMRRYEPAVRRAVRYRLTDTRLRSAMDSVDICQSVMASFFLRAAAGQYEIDSAEGITQLLVGMAKKKLAMQARRHRAQKRDNRRVVGGAIEELPISDRAHSPSRQVAAKELLGEVRRRLSDEERLLVEWRQDGIEWVDIAARLGSTPEAVRKKFTRAMDRVAVQLGIEEEDEGDEKAGE
jgi:RNA polymerase sigma-70 factor (ECF subfamily)